MFLPLCGGVFFLSVAKGFIASLPCPAPLGWCSLLLPSLESLVSPSRLHVHPMRSTCWLSGLPSRIFPRPQFLCPGHLGRSLFVLRAKRSYCRVLRFGSPAPILHRLLVRSRLRGVFVARAVVPHLAFRFVGFVFALPSFLIVASVSLQDGTVPFSSACWRSPFLVLFHVSRPPPPSDSLPGQFL